METTAAVCRAFGAPLDIETIEITEPGPGEVADPDGRMRDLSQRHLLYRRRLGGRPARRLRPRSRRRDRGGRPGVTRLKPGDPVVVTLIRNCGFCPACAEGAPVFCEEVFPLDRQTPLHDASGRPLGQGLRTGAFAGRMVVDASQAVAIPKDMKLDVASLIACGVLTGLGAVVNTATSRRDRAPS